MIPSKQAAFCMTYNQVTCIFRLLAVPTCLLLPSCRGYAATEMGLRWHNLMLFTRYVLCYTLGALSPSTPMSL